VNIAGTEAPRRGRPPKAEAGDTRARILDAALDGFSRQGYTGTSIRQIARAVGIRESSLYNHFPSKQAIFDALLAETGPGAVLELLESDVDRSGHPAVVIRQLVEQIVDHWDEPRSRQFISVVLREGGPTSALVAGGIAGEIQRVLEGVSTIFREWIDAGLIRGDFPATHLVWELMAPIGTIRMVNLRADAPEEARAQARTLAAQHAEYFLACVLRESQDPMPSRMRRQHPGPDPRLLPRAPEGSS